MAGPIANTFDIFNNIPILTSVDIKTIIPKYNSGIYQNIGEENDIISSLDKSYFVAANGSIISVPPGNYNNCTFNLNTFKKYKIINTLFINVRTMVFEIEDVRNGNIFILKLQQIISENKLSGLREALIQHIIYETTKYTDHFDCPYSAKVHQVFILNIE
jgi:hypothetical protein